MYRLRSGIALALGRQLGAGGEGKVYAVEGVPRSAAKIYREADPHRGEKLRTMIARAPTDPTRGRGHVSIAWPEELILDARGEVVGFVMPLVDHASTKPLFALANPHARRTSAPGFTWRYLLGAGENLARAMAALHARGYVIGDVNESNVRVSRSARVTLIDCDSMQVRSGRGRVYRCTVGKPEYTPPELQDANFARDDRTPEHDRFGLGVLVFMLLMGGVHPFDGVWRGAGEPPQIGERIRSGLSPYIGSRGEVQAGPWSLPPTFLPPPVRALVVPCFGAGHAHPGRRPPPEEWGAALAEAANALRACGRNPNHVYGRHLGATCPWCERVARGMKDPFPESYATAGAPPAAATTQPSVAGRQRPRPASRRRRPPAPASIPTPVPSPVAAARSAVASAAAPAPTAPSRSRRRTAPSSGGRSRRRPRWPGCVMLLLLLWALPGLMGWGGGFGGWSGGAFSRRDTVVPGAGLAPATAAGPSRARYADAGDATWVALRAQPHQSSRLRARIPHGARLRAWPEVVRGAGGWRWYRVAYGRTTGYVLARQLVAGKPPAPTRTPADPTATPRSAPRSAAAPPIALAVTEAGVRLRARTARGGRVVAVLRVGDHMVADATTIEGRDGAGWRRVRADERRGDVTAAHLKREGARRSVVLVVDVYPRFLEGVKLRRRPAPDAATVSGAPVGARACGHSARPSSGRMGRVVSGDVSWRDGLRPNRRAGRDPGRWLIWNRDLGGRRRALRALSTPTGRPHHDPRPADALPDPPLTDRTPRPYNPTCLDRVTFTEAAMTVSLWQDEGALERVECDVAVVGAGVVGAYLAHRLAREGRSVTVLEARFPAAGATGRNAGMALAGLVDYYHVAAGRWGRERARALWELTLLNGRKTRALHDALGLPYDPSGSLLLAGDDREAREVEAAHRLMREDSLPGVFHGRDPLGRGFAAALEQPQDIGIDPAAFTRALLASSGARVIDGCEVYDLEPEAGGVRLGCRRATVRAEHALLATNAYTPLLRPELGDAIRPVRGQVLLTAPSPRVLPTLCYANYGYEYLRQLPDGRVLMGGCRKAHAEREVGYEDRTTPEVQAALEGFLRARFAEVSRRIERRWSGVMGFTPHGLPLVGRLAELPCAGYAVGFNGHGLGIGFVAADELVDTVVGGKQRGIFAVMSDELVGAGTGRSSDGKTDRPPRVRAASA